jgi:hypothetical protein
MNRIKQFSNLNLHELIYPISRRPRPHGIIVNSPCSEQSPINPKIKLENVCVSSVTIFSSIFLYEIDAARINYFYFHSNLFNPTYLLNVKLQKTRNK